MYGLQSSYHEYLNHQQKQGDRKDNEYMFLHLFICQCSHHSHSQLKEAAVFSDNPVYTACTATNKRHSWQLAGECSFEFSALKEEDMVETKNS